MSIKISDLKKWDKVEVTWVDSLRSTCGWIGHKTEFNWRNHYKYLKIKTMGYFIQHTEDVISLCMSYGFKEVMDETDEADVLNIFSIPKGCIKTLRKVK